MGKLDYSTHAYTSTQCYYLIETNPYIRKITNKSVLLTITNAQKMVAHIRVNAYVLNMCSRLHYIFKCLKYRISLVVTTLFLRRNLLLTRVEKLTTTRTVQTIRSTKMRRTEIAVYFQFCIPWTEAAP